MKHGFLRLTEDERKTPNLKGLAADYDQWFDDHAEVYHTQLRLTGRAVPPPGPGFEVQGLSAPSRSQFLPDCTLSHKICSNNVF
jgi:hypothetical protein